MIKDHIQSALQTALQSVGVRRDSLELTHPKDADHGDYATGLALSLAKELKDQPMVIAQKLVDALPMLSDVDKVEVVAPGFINFTLSSSALVNEMKEITSEKANFGHSTRLQGQTWLIEHTSPNPNKAMHLGHLRNNTTGMAIANLWEAQGVKVLRDCIDNDRGIAIAKLMWGYLKFARKDHEHNADLHYWFMHQDEWNEPEDLGLRPDKFVDQLYVLASDDFKDKEVERQVRQMVVDWENHDEINWELWKKVLGYSHQGQEMTLTRLGNHYDKVWHEHEHYQKGKDLVELGLQKNVFRELDDGAILTDLDKYGISDTIVQKADGTALYITQDLALTQLKKATFHPDKIFWVIGPEQSLAMKQVFAVCEQLGIGKLEEFTHIPFGYMSIKGQGKMSSRAGNVVYIDDLIDAAKTEVLNIMKGEFISDDERQDVAEKIAVGAVKYSILHVGRMTGTAFDFATSLSLDGDSGPYLQYTYARCRSVARRAAAEGIDDQAGTLPVAYQLEEMNLLRWLYRFPEVMTEAANQMAPNLVAGFLLELAQRYNAFYNACPILTAETSDIKAFRLQVTAAVAQVLKNGLKVLGIETVEKM